MIPPLVPLPWESNGVICEPVVLLCGHEIAVWRKLVWWPTRKDTALAQLAEHLKLTQPTPYHN
jgi:hypothetical protein